MNESDLPMTIDRLRIEISKLDPSCTVAEFMAPCELASWDAASTGTGFSAYTWWLEDGFSLHACFVEGPGICTNRFGPCGISRAGAFVWKLSQQEDHWNSMRGMTVEDLAAATHHDSKNG